MPTNDEEVQFDFSCFEDMLPDACAPIHGWRIIFFINDKGDEQWRWACEGDPTLSSTIGVMQMVAFDILHNGTMMGHVGDDDE